MNELDVLKKMHVSQRQWRMASLLSFIAIIAISSFILVVLARDISGVFVQIIMILSMISVAGVVFLDVVSFVLNKKFFKQDIVHAYLFKHSKSSDFKEDADIIIELIKDRRAAAQEQKRG